MTRFVLVLVGRKMGSLMAGWDSPVLGDDGKKGTRKRMGTSL